MKRISFVGLKFSLVISLFALAGCHKFDWDWHKHNPDCRIEQIGYWQNASSDTNTAKFYYNHKGYPTVAVHEGLPDKIKEVRGR